MLRINQQRSSAGAKSYYSTGLTQEGYYTRDEILGRWGGHGAERLGLVGEVTRPAFLALCDNLNPNTGEHLTQWTRAQRTVGYDFTFNAPKSLSVLYALTQDEQLLTAFRTAVQQTMRTVEADVTTRVRQGGQDAERRTGNLLYAEFVHLTARPVGGLPDPHMHAHIFVFNATHDSAEQQWKAIQFRDLVRDAHYFEALFHAQLSKALADLNYGITRTAKGWELAGLDKKLLDKFSRRTALIEETARRKGIVDAKEKAELGAKTREKKQLGLEGHALRDSWQARLTPQEQQQLERTHLRHAQPQQPPSITAEAAVEHALQHHLERASVVPERRVLTVALQRGYGTLAPEQVQSNLANRAAVLRHSEPTQILLTTRGVLAEEAAMLRFARAGRGQCRPFGTPPAYRSSVTLNDQQQAAEQHILHSTDRVMLIRGAAGTGKTTLLKSAAEALAHNGQRVAVFAPTTEAARAVLRQEGFEHAETVARLLVDRKQQERIKGQVLWIDEAGLLSVPALRQVFQIAEEQHARVVLMGDSRQHNAVARGDAFRLLETQAGLIPAQVNDIRRQQGEYKAAITDLAAGNLAEGLATLDKLGALRVVSDEQRPQLVAAEFLQARHAGRTALVVAPTHAEGRLVTEAIRTRLQEEGYLGKQERTFTRLESYGLTQSMRQDAVNYRVGDVVQFHQNARGFKKGERVTVFGHDAQGGVLVTRTTGAPQPLPLDQAQRFDLYEITTVRLAIGEQIRITQNGMTANRSARLINGTVLRVQHFDPQGNIILDNGQTIAKNYGHLTHGYCTTSHSAQGKTVDRVIVSLGPSTYPAASQEQLYVSASRGRERCTIFCADKQELHEAVAKSSARRSATELLQARLETTPRQQMLQHGMQQRRQAFLAAFQRLWQRRPKLKEPENQPLPQPERGHSR